MKKLVFLTLALYIVMFCVSTAYADYQMSYTVTLDSGPMENLGIVSGCQVKGILYGGGSGNGYLNGQARYEDNSLCIDLSMNQPGTIESPQIVTDNVLDRIGIGAFDPGAWTNAFFRVYVAQPVYPD